MDRGVLNTACIVLFDRRKNPRRVLANRMALAVLLRGCVALTNLLHAFPVLLVVATEI